MTDIKCDKCGCVVESLPHRSGYSGENKSTVLISCDYKGSRVFGLKLDLCKKHAEEFVTEMEERFCK